MRIRLATLTMAAAFLLPGPLAAGSGPFTDDLSKCLVQSTTAADRVDLVRWMFAAASAHPAVKSVAKVSAETIEQENRKMGAMLMRLITETCREATLKAVTYEGSSALEQAFEILGSVAGKELFASPEVVAAMSGVEKYLDATRLADLGKAATAPAAE